MKPNITGYISIVKLFRNSWRFFLSIRDRTIEYKLCILSNFMKNIERKKSQKWLIIFVSSTVPTIDQSRLFRYCAYTVQSRLNIYYRFQTVQTLQILDCVDTVLCISQTLQTQQNLDYLDTILYFRLYSYSIVKTVYTQIMQILVCVQTLETKLCKDVLLTVERLDGHIQLIEGLR